MGEERATGGAERGSGRHHGRFFVADPAGPPTELLDDDLRHLLRVLRARPGDRLDALDGRGGSTPLEVAETARNAARLTELGPTRRDPAPGASGAPLPSIEVRVAPPRPNRVEPMVDRLTQLGAARLGFLLCSRTGPEERRTRTSRLERVLREACKQSGRTWLPTWAEARTVDALEPSGPTSLTLVADPAAETPLLGALEAARPVLEGRTEPGSDWTPEPAIRLLIGPEGGFDGAELERLRSGGARAVRLGPSILRIETAAEALLAATVLAASR